MTNRFLSRPIESVVFQLEEKDGQNRLRFRASDTEWSYRYWGAVRMDVAGIDLKRIGSPSGVPFLVDHIQNERYSDKTAEDFHHGYIFNGEVVDDVLYLDVEFNTDSGSIEFYEKIKKGERRGGSIGLHNEFETALEATGRIVDERPELGLVYTRSELVEFSSVLVPQQADTGVVFDQGGDGKMFFLPANQITYEQEFMSRSKPEPETEPVMTQTATKTDPPADPEAITPAPEAQFAIGDPPPEGAMPPQLQRSQPADHIPQILKFAAENDCGDFAVKFMQSEPSGTYQSFLERFAVRKTATDDLAKDDPPEFTSETIWAADVLQKIHTQPFGRALATRLGEDRDYHIEFMAGYAGAEKLGSSDRRTAEHKAALEVSWSHKFQESGRFQAFPPELLATPEGAPDIAGQSWFVPTGRLVGDESGESFALDSYSVRDVMPRSVPDDLYMNKVVARTPVMGLVNRRAFNAPTVRVRKETTKPSLTEIVPGYIGSAIRSTEVTAGAASTAVYGHVDVEPRLLYMYIDVPNITLMLQGDQLRRDLENSAIEQVGSASDKFIVQELQDSATSNATAITAAVLNATGVGSGEALLEAIGGAAKLVQDANYRMMNGAYISGTSLRLRLLAKADGSGGGERIISDVGGIDKEIDYVRGLGRLIWSTQLAAGGASNQAKAWQAYFGALQNFVFGTWVATRMWMSTHDPLLTRINMNALIGGVMTREDAGTKVTVTTA